MVKWHLQWNWWPAHAMSRQHCKNCDVKWETVHCYLRNVDHCCTWSEHVVEGGLMFLLESQRVFPPVWLICCYITNHLWTGPLRNSEFCLPWISMFSRVALVKHGCSRETKFTIPLSTSWLVLNILTNYCINTYMTDTPNWPSHNTFKWLLLL